MRKTARDIVFNFFYGIFLILGGLLGFTLLPFQIHRYIFWVSKSKQAKRSYYRTHLKSYIKHWIHLGCLDTRANEEQLHNEWLVGGMYVTPHRSTLIRRFRDDFFYKVCPSVFQSRSHHGRMVKN